MTKCNFYAICAKGLGKEDGFYKVKPENFGDFFCSNKTTTLDLTDSLEKFVSIFSRYPNMRFSNRKMHASGGWHDEIVHKPVAFVVEVNSHLPRPKISFDKEVKIFDSAENVGDEPINTQSPSENVGGAEYEPKNSREYCEMALKNEAQRKSVASVGADMQKDSEPTSAGESFGEFKDTQNAQNNAKIQNEALKERLIAEAREDCKRLRTIFIKIEVNTTLYFEDEKGEIKHLWFKNNEIEQYGAIKTLMIMGKAFVLVDFAATRDPLIRFCQGFQSEFLNEPKEDEE